MPVMIKKKTKDLTLGELVKKCNGYQKCGGCVECPWESTICGFILIIRHYLEYEIEVEV